MIRGYAVGGGASIAMACDLRICTPDAKFGVPISRTLGNCLSMNNYARLVDLIGPARTKELIFTAKMVEAADAQAIGLANDVIPGDEIEARTQALAEQIAGHAPRYRGRRTAWSGPHGGRPIRREPRTDRAARTNLQGEGVSGRVR